MIKEVSIIKTFDDYRKAMDYTKTILEDVVLLTMHGENGKKLHGPISKVNIQEIINLFGEGKEWQGLTDEDREAIALLVEKMGMEGYGTLAIAAAIRKGEM
jgi:hypothetical protein